MNIQVDPGGQIFLHLPLAQLDNSFHLLHKRLILPGCSVVFLLVHKQDEQGFTQGEEGRQIFHC